jgi:hypothetical protein
MSNEQRPLFSVGERVKLVSVNYPECNGVYHVEEVCEKDYDEFDNFTYAYVLTDDTGWKWSQLSLRKIYDSGEYSFDELMNVLKSPIVVSV